MQLASLLAQQEAQTRKAFPANRFGHMIKGLTGASRTHAGMWEEEEQKNGATAGLVQKTPKSMKVRWRLKTCLLNQQDAGYLLRTYAENM